MSAIARRHPLHPAAGVGSLVPRLGHGQQGLLALLAQRGVTTTVSPLHFMAHNRELALFAGAERPLGLALDPMTFLRQVPPSHRGKNYRARKHGDDPVFHPGTDPITAETMLGLAQDPLDAQRAHGATLLMTSSHLAGPVGSRSRELDLRLAQLGIDHFDRERMDQPAEHAAVDVPRELFASLVVERRVIGSPSDVEALAAAYAALDVAGYWVKIEGFSHACSLTELRGAAALLGALSSTGRPVVSCGPGRLHLPLLVGDISSSVGLGEREQFRLPDTSRPPPRGPRIRPVYHPAYGRSFDPGARPARRAFERVHCRCGAHRKDRPPAGPEVDEHCACVRAREAEEALRGSIDERYEWLEAVADTAADAAHDAGVDVVPFAALDAIRQGLDAGRGRGELIQTS